MQHNENFIFQITDVQDSCGHEKKGSATGPSVAATANTLSNNKSVQVNLEDSVSGVSTKNPNIAYLKEATTTVLRGQRKTKNLIYLRWDNRTKKSMSYP